MNADRLLALYDRIADAPDAVARLRRFILDLAVRGKLVPQDPRDEPVREVSQLPSSFRDDLEEFPLPRAWRWVAVDRVGKSRLGKMLDKAKNRGSLRPYLRNTNVRWFDFDLSDLREMQFENKELDELSLSDGDVLVCEGGEPGRAAVWDDRMPGLYFQKAIHRVRFRDFVYPAFFVKALRASADDGRLTKSFTGSGIKHFTGKGLDSYRFPLPPLAEQHRIVAKVDELMALCDRLEAARGAREATRDRFAAAGLARLRAPDADPAHFADHARFAIENLAALTTRPDQIKTLRQTILDLAVRGKLVPQDPNDEPASELLRGLRAERQKVRREKNGLREEDHLFDIPEAWCWAALGDVITEGPQNGISPQATTSLDAPKAITLTATTSGKFDGTFFKRVDLSAARGGDFWLRDGDLLFQRGNTRDYVGIAAIYDGPPDEYLFPDLIMRVRVSPLVSLRYIHLSANSPMGRAYMAANASGAQLTMPKINQTMLVALPIPLPPLAEQHRIVAEVDALMALCDRLEASLAAAADTRRRLLDALIAEALAPVGPGGKEIVP